MANRIWERDVPKNVVLEEVPETPVFKDSRRRRMRHIRHKYIKIGTIEYKPSRKGFVAEFSCGDHCGLSGFGTTVREAILDSLKNSQTYYAEYWRKTYERFESDKEDGV